MDEPREPKKLTPFQEGMEHVRSELWPDLPDGYKRDQIHGTGFVSIGAPTCVRCGAYVADTKAHDDWHALQGAAAQAAYRADVMTRPIGGV